MKFKLSFSNLCMKIYVDCTEWKWGVIDSTYRKKYSLRFSTFLEVHSHENVSFLYVCLITILRLNFGSWCGKHQKLSPWYRRFHPSNVWISFLNKNNPRKSHQRIWRRPLLSYLLESYINILLSTWRKCIWAELNVTQLMVQG